MDRMKLPRWCLKVGFLGTLMYGASWVKLSYIVGSYMLFFSGSSVAVPLLGAFSSVSTIFAISWMRALLHLVLFDSLSFHSFTHFIPGLCASLHWARRTWVIGVALPILCMAFFWLHPVGAGAWVYTLYWLIPIVLYMTRTEQIWAQALGSTFIAHAVGSVIWLYTKPMTSAVWLSLIPVVAIERITYTLGMVVFYYGLCYCLMLGRSSARTIARKLARQVHF